MAVKLNLGSGDNVIDGFTNVDKIPNKGIMVCDLDKYPLPWKNNSVSYILCSHLLEHLENPINFMLELHRISKNRTMIDMYVPHFSFFGTYAELSHKIPGVSYFAFGHRGWNKELFDKFKVKAKLNFTRANYTWLNHIFNPIINLSPMIYERFFCYLLPCSEVYFKLEVIKSKSPCRSSHTEVRGLFGLLDAQSVPRTKMRGLSNTLTSNEKSK
jgi:hypothetical protein